MKEQPLLLKRGVYVHGATLGEVRHRVMSFPLFHGGSERASIPISRVCDGWLLVGLPKPVPTRMLFDIVAHLSTAQDADRTILVKYKPGVDEQTYYAVIPEFNLESEQAPVCHGRRDDGRGLVFDTVAEFFQVTKRADGFTLDTFAYLQEQGVPQLLLPTARGLTIDPATRVPVQVDVD